MGDLPVDKDDDGDRYHDHDDDHEYGCGHGRDGGRDGGPDPLGLGGGGRADFFVLGGGGADVRFSFNTRTSDASVLTICGSPFTSYHTN